MASVISINGGVVTSVYDDALRPLLEALGELTVRRASTVEYDGQTREWVAVSEATGEEIARGRNRADVIAAEVRWLEERILKGERV